MLSRKALGFTLVELMVATAISGFIAIGIYKLIRSQAQNAGGQLTASQDLRNTQRFRTLLYNDISQAGYDPRYIDLGRAPISPFTSAASDRFTVQADFNLSGTVGDQTSTQDPETLTYSFNAASGEISRNGNVILQNVGSFSLTYYDSS